VSGTVWPQILLLSKFEVMASGDASEQSGNGRATRAKRVPRAVREQQMLDAAVAVFAERGFHQSSMDTIATASGISKPMLYLYYGSKDELFGAILDRESQRFLEAASQGSSPDFTARETLERTLAAVLDFVAGHRDAWRVLVREGSSVGEFADQIARRRARLVELTADLLRAGTKEPEQDFDLMAVALVGAGEAVANRVAEGDLDPARAVEVLTGLAWRGLSGGPRQTD